MLICSLADPGSEPFLTLLICVICYHFFCYIPIPIEKLKVDKIFETIMVYRHTKKFSPGTNEPYSR
jgi:hypothetical protein